jgi:hypothetical protein
VGSGGIAPPFLTTGLDGGEWSASRPSHFTPAETAPGRKLGGPQSQSGRYEEEKNPVPARNQTPAVHSVARRYTDCVVWHMTNDFGILVLSADNVRGYNDSDCRLHENQEQCFKVL